MAEMLHFPFGTFERTEAVVVNNPDELMAHAPASMNMTEQPERFTDHDGYLKRGCYDVLDGIEIFNSNPIAVNLAELQPLQFRWLQAAAMRRNLLRDEQ